MLMAERHGFSRLPISSPFTAAVCEQQFVIPLNKRAVQAQLVDENFVPVAVGRSLSGML